PLGIARAGPVPCTRPEGKSFRDVRLMPTLNVSTVCLRVHHDSATERNCGDRRDYSISTPPPRPHDTGRRVRVRAEQEMSKISGTATIHRILDSLARRWHFREFNGVAKTEKQDWQRILV